jgi:hypothetical protein
MVSVLFSVKVERPIVLALAQICKPIPKIAALADIYANHQKAALPENANKWLGLDMPDQRV